VNPREAKRAMSLAGRFTDRRSFIQATACSKAG
jgi:hypothetical protein